jgi:hypothetical protein
LSSSQPSSDALSSTAPYPRPQLVRDVWTPLDGEWQFGVGPLVDSIDRTIRVPFAPETPASGLSLTGYIEHCWYRRAFAAPKLAAGERCLLHFEAADYETRVFVNGQLVGSHEGGYTRFSFDVTAFLHGEGEQQLHVHCHDDPHDLAKPRGKQDWLPEAHSIWYPRTTGIWQSVWLETVPATHLRSLRWTPSVEGWSLTLDAKLAGSAPGTRLRVQLSHEGRTLSDDTFSFTSDQLTRTITLADGGIDSVRDDLLWFPWRPKLIDATLTLIDAQGKEIDRVRSYTAMRSVSTNGDRFMLNGRPIELRLLLDQGYWVETGLTPPDDAAIVRDIELVQSMGFNGVRKHQKIESERFLHFADRMGLLVWEEMPSPYRFSGETVRRTLQQWTAAVERDASHPCIIAWVPINESWGAPDLPLRADQRAFVEALYHLTKSLDPTRPVVSNDGWEMSRTDLINVHDYDHDPRRLAERYDVTRRPIAEILKSERPGHRALLLSPEVYAGQPLLLTEFGGIALSDDANATWGYSRATSSADLAQRYAKLLTAVRGVRIFGGFCYTQFTDTYQEANGLVTMDRRPKFDAALIAIATRGAGSPAEASRLQAMIDGHEPKGLNGDGHPDDQAKELRTSPGGRQSSAAASVP